MAYQELSDKITLWYEEFGSGDRYLLSSQMEFLPEGMHTILAEKGWHVFCITLRGFRPSSLVTEDYGENWYDVFADDVAAFADRKGIERFAYMGASHGAGIGWHLLLRHGSRVKAFIAAVPGPHSLNEGTMSYRQMLEQGIIKEIPRFDPEPDDDEKRVARRKRIGEWSRNRPKQTPEEQAIDYGRPLMRLKTEEALCAALETIQTPVLMLGGVNDPISRPDLMVRTLQHLPHCKMVIYSNAGHGVDHDITEEAADEAARFLENAEKTGKWYLPLK